MTTGTTNTKEPTWSNSVVLFPRAKKQARTCEKTLPRPSERANISAPTGKILNDAMSRVKNQFGDLFVSVSGGFFFREARLNFLCGADLIRSSSAFHFILFHFILAHEPKTSFEDEP